MISQEIKDRLLGFYSKDGEERIGFISKDFKIVEVENHCNDPKNGFVVSTEDIIEFAINQECIATWHTHPNESSNLSGEDFKMFSQWSNMFHIIIGNDGLNIYKIDENGNVVVI